MACRHSADALQRRKGLQRADCLQFTKVSWFKGEEDENEREPMI